MIVKRVLGEPIVTQIVNTAYSLAGGSATNDSNISLTIYKPDGTTTSVPNGSLTAVATGIYQYAYSSTAVGLHLFKYAGAYGACELAVEVVDTPEVL